MIYFKISLLFCTVALLLAITSNAAFFLGARLMGGIAVSATRVGWVVLLGGWWVISFVFAFRLATVLQIFPFSSGR